MLSNRALLMERYPEIAFLFHCLPFTPLTLFTDAKGRLNARRGEWLLCRDERPSTQQLEEVEILYYFGVGLGYAYAELLPWLEAKKGRRLLFLEEDLAVIDALLESPLAEGLLRDSRVHLRFVPDRRAWPEAIEALAQEFVSDKLACRVLEAYRPLHGRRYRRLSLQLMRSSASLHALLSESLHSYKIFANLHPNLKKIPEAFYANQWKGAFKGVPAILCGAGPSLREALPQLRELGERALLIGGGSAIAALSRGGVEPHLGMVLDPNPEEYERLLPSTAFETPILYANRVLPAIFSTCNGPIGYLRSDTGGLSESWIEERLGIEGEAIGPDLGREAFSVTTLALAFAYALGCDPIILTGVDLAFTGMRRYAEGVIDGAGCLLVKELEGDTRVMEKLLRRKDRTGKRVYTLLKWVMESSAIGGYAKRHPDRQFINATSGGIGFPHLPYQPLAEVVERSCTRQYDLRGRIFAEIEETRFQSIDSARIAATFEELKGSLKRQLVLCDALLSERGGRRSLIEMDFCEEPAFDCFLQSLGPALDRITHRYFPEEEREQVKWREIRRVITEYLAVLEGSA